MRMYKTIFLLSLVLITVTSSCIQTPPDIKISQPTGEATKVTAPTPEPTLTPTLVQTNTPTSIPVLSEKEAKAQLLDLLANDGACRLPCIWDIMPGETFYTEARTVFLPFDTITISMNLSDNDGSDSVWLTYDEGASRTFVKFSYLYASDGIISRIVFNAAEYKETDGNRSLVFDSNNFGERLSSYMLPGILSELGKPTSVIISTSGKQIAGSGGFDVVLVYPEQGIFIHYTMQMESVGKIAFGCPANAQVELELYPPGNADAFNKAISQTHWDFIWPEPIDNPSWKPIDKATSMSINEFYETFRQPTDQCIETPLEGWYIPEGP